MDKVSSRQSIVEYIIFAFLVFGVVSVCAWSKGIEIAPEGPSKQILLTAYELLKGEQIDSPRYYQLSEYLLSKSKEEHAFYWQDVFSMTSTGILLPKHCLLLSIILTPFVFVFGEFGALILNTLLLTGLFHASVNLGQASSKHFEPFVLLVVLVLGTQIPFYVYGVHYDVLGATLIIAGLNLIRRSDLWGAFLMGASIFVRASNTLFLPFLFFAFLERKKRCQIWDRILGMGSVSALWLSINYVWWGGPLITAHHRMPNYFNGQVLFDAHNVEFSFQLLIADIYQKLFDTNAGLLLYNPALLFVLVLFATSSIDGYRRDYWLIQSACIVQVLLIFSYNGWSASYYGSRYLLSVIVFEAIFLSVLLSKRVDRYLSKRKNPIVL